MIAKFLHLAIANLPIEKGNFGIDGNGGALFGCVNKLTNFTKSIVLSFDGMGHGI
jgi:hypothetical protein